MALSIIANIGAFVEGCFHAQGYLPYVGGQRSMQQRFPTGRMPLLTKGV